MPLQSDKITNPSLEHLAQKIGHEIFKRSQSLSKIFQKNFFIDSMMEWAMKNPEVKVDLFRFVDVLPNLISKNQIKSHMKEYFLRNESEFPFYLQSALKISLSNPLTDFMTSFAVKQNVFAMAHNFITGKDSKHANHKLEKLWKDGICFTADILGEAVVSDVEALGYQKRYIELITGLSKEVQNWQPQSLLEKNSIGYIPRANISVKCTSLYSQIRNLSFRQSVEGIKNNLRTLLSEAVANNVFIYLDAEQNDVREIILRVAEELFCEKPFKSYPHLGLVIQAYLKSAQIDLQRMIALSKSRKFPLTIRLVKGAYWDYENILAKQRGWSIPVFEHKYQTDTNFERCADLLVESYPHVLPAFASHNVRSLSYALAKAQQSGLRKIDYEVQMLYGMAYSFKQAIREMGYRVRDYAPIGDLLPGMSYLVRRLLENTSNEGFLRQSFAEYTNVKTLLQNPAHRRTIKNHHKNNHVQKIKKGKIMFANEAHIDFSIKQNRDDLPKVIKNLREKLPIKVPVVIHGRTYSHLHSMKCVNPSQTTEVISQICLATPEEADLAVESSLKALNSWTQWPVKKRADVLRQVANQLTIQRTQLMALMVLEVGKSFDEADADVCEAIDFCRYYAEQAEHLFTPQKMGVLPGESNLYEHQARGITVTISPWNFPLAILCGMTVAPLVCGNPVIMKPAEQSSAIAFEFYKILVKSGVPDEAIQFLPGQGEIVGEYLVNHPLVHVISFTGSRQVGLSIIQKSSVLAKGQKHIKKVIAEMGGKNAIIVDDDADLDEAVTACLHSAFGYAGQKCSALSRILIHKNIYDKFKKRFVEALSSLKIGPAEDVSSSIGPVIDLEAYERLQKIIKKNKNKIIAQHELPKNLKEMGNFVPPTVFEESDEQSELAQQELFGPLVTLFKVKNMNEAIQIMNNVDYALTGGIFSRSPVNIERARREIEVGNLYINRGITGAFVNRQPFGGFKLSGVGGKAGGPDYLLHFVEPKTITENTVRRGFAPDLSE